jgi:SHS family lactate transporter-like MFS transporter
MVRRVSKPSHVSSKKLVSILRTDIYPSYLKVQKGFSSDKASVATIVGQCGAIVGGAICGYYSQFFGRRLTVVVACCFGACMIPLWTLPNTWGPIVAGTFFIQAAVNGAWGVMPILLNEYAPPQFRGVFPGTVYQLGESLYPAFRLPCD